MCVLKRVGCSGTYQFMSVNLITITDRTVTPGFVAVQLLSLVKNTECPVCLDSIAGRSVTVFNCHTHAVCAVCAERLDRCPLCRAVESVFQPMYVPIGQLEAEIGSTNIPFDIDGIRSAFRSLVVPRDRLSTVQCVAIDALSNVLNGELKWSDLWKMKQFTRHCNVSGLIPAWGAFIQVVSNERLRVTRSLQPYLITLGQDVELVMPLRNAEGVSPTA